MPRLAANLSYMWQDLPYLDRFAVAADAGFDGVEILFPYDVAAKETQRALLSTDLPLVAMNAPPPNYTGGARGFAASPGGTARFQQDLRRALRYCDVLRVPMLHLMAGAAEGSEARETLVDNMRWACKAIPDGLTLTLGPQPQAIIPGSFLVSYQQTAEIIQEVGSKALLLQYDSCVAQVLHKDAVAIFREYQCLIGHIVIADAPDRSTPGTGQVDFNSLQSAVLTRGYEGWISAAFSSKSHREQTLDWVTAWK